MAHASTPGPKTRLNVKMSVKTKPLISLIMLISFVLISDCVFSFSSSDVTAQNSFHQSGTRQSSLFSMSTTVLGGGVDRQAPAEGIEKVWTASYRL